jgi:hypothetical protein
MLRKTVFALLCCLTAVSFANSAFAQETSAGITGRVTDPSGAAIAGAGVTATDQERGTVWPAKTNEDGIYAFPRVPVGIYELRIEVPGFKTFAKRDIQLELNQRARLDAQMEVGAVTERMEVTGEAPLLQTETTQVGSVIASNTIVNTPLVSRNFVQLTLLAPGVTTPDPSSMLSGARSNSGGRPYVNGNRKEGNNFLLDGVDNNQVADNLTAYQPNIDAIQEFKMITNNASAEFGNFQGGIVNVTIKSGTNNFHGNLFEFFRNDKLNANNWGRNWTASPRTAQRWNVFGGTFGGRIVRDKLFFFMDYQGTRRANPGSTSSTSIIPAEFRQGDFSRLLSEKGIQLYNPYAVNADGTRQPFANNQIPKSLFGPVALKLFNSPDLYPLPTGTGLQNNYNYVASSYINSDQGDIKFDYKPTGADFFTVRYSNGRQDQPGTNTFPLLYNTFSTQPFKAAVANWTRTLSATVVNEARMGVNNIMLNNGGEDKGLGNIAADLGIAGVPTGLMALNFTNGLASSLGNANVGAQTRRADTTYHFADNVTIIRGRHMMKTGGQLLRQHNNSFFAGNNGRTGFITFNGQYSWGPNPSKATSKGSPEADFMLGYPSSLGRGLSTGTWGHRKTIYGVYFQDDWRALNNLTLNLGLRWEYHTPLVEVLDRQSNFDPWTGKLRLAGKDGNSRALYEPFKKDFQPRVGFAWTPGFLGGRTVLRGAYTISSFMEGTGTNLRLPMNPPFNTEYEALNTDPTKFGSTLAQGMTVLQSADPYKNATIRLWDPFVRPAITQQWNLTVERQLPANNVLSVGYVGQHGTHLVVPMPYFQKQMMSDGTIKASPYLAGNPVLASISQIVGTETNGNQRYDSMQVSLHKRFSAGLEYQVSYTFSKGMSDSIGYYGDGGQAGSQSSYWQNLYDRRAEWGPTYFDVTHNFVASYVYDLPFGKGKKFGTAWNPVVNHVLGNWQMGGVLTLHGGFPLTMTANDVSGTKSRGPRANRSGNGEGAKEVGPGKKWFDTSAFFQPASGTFGNAGNGVVRGPGMRNFSLSLQKIFPVGEFKRFEFRGEAYNLTNTPIFGSPTRAVTSANFGEIRASQGERNVQFGLKFYF